MRRAAFGFGLANFSGDFPGSPLSAAAFPPIWTIALLPAVLGTLGTFGCFDVHQTDQGPWVIDDFEDGDLQPADRSLGPWTCSTFAPQDQDCRVADGSGNGSAYGLAFDFTIVDPPDGMGQMGGALAQTGSPTMPENFLRFGEMVFSAKLVSGTPPLPSTTVLDAQLGCSSVQLDDGETPGNVYVFKAFAVTGDWQTVSLPLNNFTSPFFNATHIRGGPAACLQHVDSVMFSIDPLLADGQSTMGQLDVDDIYFQ